TAASAAAATPDHGARVGCRRNHRGGTGGRHRLGWRRGLLDGRRLLRGRSCNHAEHQRAAEQAQGMLLQTGGGGKTARHVRLLPLLPPALKMRGMAGYHKVGSPAPFPRVIDRGKLTPLANLGYETDGLLALRRIFIKVQEARSLKVEEIGHDLDTHAP